MNDHNFTLQGQAMRALSTFVRLFAQSMLVFTCSPCPFAIIPLQAKRIYDAHHMPEHLQSFLYIYLSTQCSKLGSSPAASPAPSNATSISRDSSGRPSSGLRSSGTQRPPSGSSGQSSPHGSGAAHSGSGASLMQQPKGMRGTVRSTSLSLKASAGRESKGPSPPAQADHAEVVKHAYGLYHALRSHSAVSPILRLFWRVLSGALPEEAISQQRLLFGAVAHAARRIAYAHATMVAHQRGAAPAATNPGSNNNDKMNAMARETEAEADEHMEGAADQLASSTAKARKGKRGQRGGRLRTASPGGDPDKGEEEEEEAGEREKSAEAAPQVAIDPCDLIVSTEHMQGALQALLPGRSASELQVLLDAYSSCVASLSQQQQQQSMITVHEGSSSPDSMPSGACSLPHLEGLLQPLVLGCSTKAIAVQASTTAAGNTDWQGSRDDASRERKVQAFTGRAVGTTLSDGFVSMLLEELVDELEEASSNLTAAIFAATTAAASSPAAESGSGGRNESIAGSRGPSRASSPTLPLLPPALEPSAAPDQAIPARTSAPSPTEPAPRQTSSAFLLLGQKVPAAALVEAMVGVGLAPSDAARVVTGTLGCGTPGGASLGETLVAAWRHGMLDGVPVWSNLAAAAARATMLLQRPGMHDVQGMLTWVERLCSNMISPAGRQEDAEGGNEGEGVGQERGKDEDKAV
uniref:Uncharacterized protein n=1 Tax=Dunaliella tertiolecta TaxID=3047 RepID=A0A7S3R620_DUNTE